MGTPLTIRLSVELERADNPPLYDDLVKFPKGPRRVNRLRTLAYAGLVVQQCGQTTSVMEAQWITKPSTGPNTPGQDAIVALASMELFGPSRNE
ncbi:hypothetical protein [Janthinobacterium sp. SUN137]|uniref:hypothetical protein n=1 Tax=Janthinobacterium sp. SUN137 TaxID=3014789 RepID=UPI002713D316|nr:hypothetical protein [Janthinobacterium sp. SUN137]MDO8040300.1 hypothetical protein [Janthinobacterium sp. SUN137]